MIDEKLQTLHTDELGYGKKKKKKIGASNTNPHDSLRFQCPTAWDLPLVYRPRDTAMSAGCEHCVHLHSKHDCSQTALSESGLTNAVSS